jgi:uncharacterized BrkB/YihY/UPF0761 family membrane protein
VTKGEYHGNPAYSNPGGDFIGRRRLGLFSLETVTMTLFTLLITIVIAGVALWLINTYIPMDEKIKTILNVVVVIILIVWLFNALGLLGASSNMHMRRYHVHW